MGVYDPTSFSRPDQAKTIHLYIEWLVDFAQSKLIGHVDLKMKAVEDNVMAVILDTKDLNISRVSTEGNELQFEFKEKHDVFGSALHITMPSPLKKNDEITLRIEYETSKDAGALQWLDAQQTAGKQYPYMFSQCQAIHARSIIPCQDTPAAKAPYTAVVTVEDPLVILMSAIPQWERRARNDKKDFIMTYKFEQKVPMPTYLIAIVAGKLESRDIGPRSKVWSEKELVDKAKDEFAETETMLETAETLGGPYVWEQYDLLVLPPSFPYGGMENPCLTFVTPTLLAGDRSLANVIAHEIAHSWTGNLVTNHTWEHFWLNEGHTVFLERKIMSKMYGEQTRQFQALNGLKDLRSSIDVFGEESPLTNLVVNLDGIDPDDAFSSVPYEKGHTLLFYLETLLGGPSAFEPFLLSYISKFKYSTATTEQWKEHLYEFFADKKAVLDGVDWNSWFNKPGMPPVIPEYDQTLSAECTALAERWAKATPKTLSSFKLQDIKKFSPWQKIEFLGQLLQKDPFSKEHMEAMDKCYGLSKVENSEIKFRWLRLGIRAQWVPSIAPALKMLAEQGRMKFTRPLYRDLGAWNASRQEAIDHFKKHKSTMHSTTTQLVEKDLKL